MNGVAELVALQHLKKGLRFHRADQELFQAHQKVVDVDVRDDHKGSCERHRDYVKVLLVLDRRGGQGRLDAEGHLVAIEAYLV